MFRQYFYSVASAALLTAFYGCSSTATDEPALSDNVPVAFAPWADGSRSRAITTPDNFTENSFAVWGAYVKDTGGATPVAVFEAKEVSYGGNGWTYQDTQYWLPGMDYTFAALHPAYARVDHSSFDIVNGLEFSFTPDGTDILGASTETYHCSIDPMGPVGLKFTHLQADVQFVIKRAANLVSDVTILSASFAGISRSADYTLAGGTMHCTPTASDRTDVATASDITLPTAGAVSLFGGHVLIVPQSVPHGATFSMTYRYHSGDGQSRPYTCDLFDISSSLPNGWEAGHTYRYTLEIGADDYILFSQPEVVPWEEAGGANIIIQGDQTN